MRDHNSDSDGTNSSWCDGSGSTGTLENKRTKSNEINLDVKHYPSPIKATKNLDLNNLNKINTLQTLSNCTKTQSERLAKLSDPEL
jgi:hypothetical protein